MMAIVLTACPGAEPPPEGEADVPDEGALPDEPQEGGIVSFSMFSAPAGVFNPVLYGDSYEANVIGFIFQALVTLDEELAWEPELAREWHFENENRTLVFELQEDVTWHDGEPFTANDVKYTYDVIAHPDYPGVRTSYVQDLVGFEEFRAGETDEFEGVEVIDDHTVAFHFKEPSVVALYRASFMIIPEHIYGQYEVADLPDAPETLEFDQLVGTGPFRAADYMANQYYTLERNEDYWEGRPYLDGVVWRIVNQDVAPGMLETGEIDVITTPAGVRAADYDLVAAIPGIQMHEQPDFGYQYMGFKLNYRPQEDVAAGVVNPDNYIPNEKLQDVTLRQAIMYGIDRQGIVDGLLQGHGTVMNAPFPPASWAFDEEAVNPYPYDPDLANQMLDEAGYEDINGDGFRERPNGEELVLRLDYPTGNRTREQSAPIIAENLADIGINVDVRTPRDVGAFFDAVEDDEQGMDLFLAGWGLSAADPDPQGIWDRDTLWNFSRWDDERSEELIQLGVQSPDAFDLEFRQQVYSEWAAHVNEQLPAIFLYSQNQIWAWGGHVQGVKPDALGITRDIHEWYIID